MVYKWSRFNLNVFSKFSYPLSLLLSPPNFPMFSCTHRSASCWSAIPWLPFMTSFPSSYTRKPTTPIKATFRNLRSIFAFAEQWMMFQIYYPVGSWQSQQWCLWRCSDIFHPWLVRFLLRCRKRHHVDKTSREVDHSAAKEHLISRQLKERRHWAKDNLQNQ